MTARSSAAGASRSFSGLIMPETTSPRRKHCLHFSATRTSSSQLCQRGAKRRKRPSASVSEAAYSEGTDAAYGERQRVANRRTRSLVRAARDRLVRVHRQPQLVDRHKLVLPVRDLNRAG